MKINIWVALFFGTSLIVFGAEITPTPLVNQTQSSEKTSKIQSDNDIIVDQLDEIMDNRDPSLVSRFLREAKDPSTKALWEYFLVGCADPRSKPAQKEEQYLKIIKENPKVKFPNFTYGENYNELRVDPWTIPNQRIEPMIYFAIAELYGGEKADRYYEKILTLNGSNDWVDLGTKSKFQMEAMINLLHDYGEAGQSEKACNIAKEILAQENQHYTLGSGWGLQGSTKEEALIVLCFLSKDFNDDQKINMLKDIFLKYDCGFGHHGGLGNSYSPGVISYLWDEKYENWLIALAKDPEIKKEYGFQFFCILGDIEFDKEKRKLEKYPNTKPNWEKARQFYKEALNCGGNFCDHEGDDNVVKRMEDLKKFVAGDLSNPESLSVPGYLFLWEPPSLPCLPISLKKR